MRLHPRLIDDDRAFLLDPVRLVRWVYVGRLSLATAIFLAALLVWQDPDTEKGKLLVASLVFSGTLMVTAFSALFSEFWRRPLRSNFFYGQSVFDLLLVTAVVHVTAASGSPSQFAALYILVIATSSLLLPVGGGLLIAALGNVLYFADAVLSVGSPFTIGVWLQLGVFAIVALGSAYLSAKLKELGAGTEAELAHVRLQAADILHNIRSGIITIDVEGRLVYANPMAEQLLGTDLEALMGRPVLEKLRTVSPELVEALEHSVKDRVRTTRGEGSIATVGKRVLIGVTTTYTDGDGQRTDRTATAIFQDISDQKRMEALRLRAERLEGVAELSASLAHEIRNPLASIRSAVEQLARSPFSGADEQTLARLVLRESDRLSRLLSEFLDFARVRVARSQPLDLAHLADSTMRLAAANPNRPFGVRLTCIATSGEHIVVGDDDLLHRAVLNLLLNAIQASPDDGEVRIEVDTATPEQLGGTRYDHGAVALSVIDAGPGIPADIRDRLFDPFFTTKPGGTGLGLAVVHRAIDAHRGLVFLDTGPGGTRFTVVLPRAERSLRPVATPRSSLAVLT
ncbi:MAG TPA: ATP-binding protein [Gemmatimonadaceae bacterium]|jgi:two-component system sensor histidine kinase PilS (NtrC family)|nr:ATP-binding protein [Gemmatimonadaceae bacterium]